MSYKDVDDVIRENYQLEKEGDMQRKQCVYSFYD